MLYGLSFIKIHIQFLHNIDPSCVCIYKNIEGWYDLIDLLVHKKNVVVNHCIYSYSFSKSTFYNYIKNAQYD